MGNSRRRAPRERAQWRPRGEGAGRRVNFSTNLATPIAARRAPLESSPSAAIVDTLSAALYSGRPDEAMVIITPGSQSPTHKRRGNGRLRRPVGIFLRIVAFSALLAACRETPRPPAIIIVKDGLGREVRVPARPRRIVSLAPSVTESLLALGARDRLVGVCDFCKLPPGTAPIVRVGGMLNPSLETIRGLRPDLLIATTSGNDPSLARQAEAPGLSLYTLHTPDADAVLESVVALAKLIDEEKRGADLAESLRSRLAAVRAAIAGRPSTRVLFVVWGDPLVVPGRSSFLTDALARAGGESITADAPAAY